MLPKCFKTLFGVLNILILLLISNAEEVNKVINSFNREKIKLSYPPFCIIRHRNEDQQWEDFYMSYDRKQKIMYVQKNKEEPTVVSNFQEKENFVLCYESKLVKNQITLISLSKNYTLIGMYGRDALGRIIQQNPVELPQAMITEYQFNITSMRMFNSGNPIRYSNDTNFTARYSTQMEIIYNNSIAVDFKQYGLGPIPYFDEPFNIYRRSNGQIYVPDLFFFQYSYNYDYFYTQQFNIVKDNQPGIGTLKPLRDEIYSTIQCSTVQIDTSGTFKTISNPFQVRNSHCPLMSRDVGFLCSIEQGQEFQPINEQYLMIKRNNSFSIIDRKDFWGFYYQIEYACLFAKNETNKDLYYYELGEFKINMKDWLGVIILQTEQQSQILLTQAVYTEEEEDLIDYRFYQINLEQKTPPILITKQENFQPIRGYKLYDGFTYFRGVPITFKPQELNRFSMLYLVNGTEVIKLQFNPRIMLNEKSFLSFQQMIIIASVLCFFLSFGLFFNYFDYKKRSRLIKETIHKQSISTIIDQNNGDDKNKFKNFYLSSVKEIFSFSYKERINEFQIIQGIQGQKISMPRGNLHRMIHDNNNIYSVLFFDETQIDNAWQFIKSIQSEVTPDRKFNQNHFIFSKILNVIQVSNWCNDTQISRIMFVVQTGNKFNANIEFVNNFKKKIYGIFKNFNYTKYDEELDQSPSHIIQIKQILIRKFTIALKFLRTSKINLPNDFIEVLGADIFIVENNDVSINPLLILYALSRNLLQNEKDDKQKIDDRYLQATYKFIQYLKDTVDKNIPLIQHDSFDDCLRFYDFHISFPELVNRFIKKSQLGEGAFGQVYEAQDQMQNEDSDKIEQLAIKENTLRSEMDIYSASKEFNTWKRLTFNKIDGIVSLRYGIFINNISIKKSDGSKDRDFDLCYFIQELGEITLQKELEVEGIKKNFTSQELHQLMYQICKGVNQMHNNAKTIHMDISLDNIIKTKDQQYKLLDLGAALAERNFSSLNISTHFQFKDSYLCPLLKQKIEEIKEIILKKKNFQQELIQIKKDFQLLKQNDCYALGCIFYEVVTPALVRQAHNQKTVQELEDLRLQKIDELEKYKESFNKKSDRKKYYPNYLIECIQSLLRFTEIQKVFEVLEENNILLEHNMI